VPAPFARTPGLDPADLSPARAGCARNTDGSLTLTVTVSYRFRFVVGLLPTEAQTITATQTQLF
jgi:hypothetical protein